MECYLFPLTFSDGLKDNNYFPHFQKDAKVTVSANQIQKTKSVYISHLQREKQ